VPLSNPITGIAGCCARAASGHATAPPNRVMNVVVSLDHLVGASQQRWRTSRRSAFAVARLMISSNLVTQNATCRFVPKVT
jgi:hypothetical protein